MATRLVNLRLKRISLVSTPANEEATVVLFKSVTKDDNDYADVMAGTCSKCSGSVTKGDSFCMTCGSKLPEWGEGSAADKTPTTDATRDAVHLKEDVMRKIRVAAPLPEDDIEGRIEKMLTSGASPEEIDATFANKRFGSDADTARAIAARSYEGYRDRVNGVSTVRKSGAAEAVVALANRMVRDLGISHAEAHGLILKSESGRALYDCAAAEATVTV